jgi:hypothetical protein
MTTPEDREPEEFRDIVQELRRTAPEPPPVAWGRWRAELRARLESRATRGVWWRRPLPVALSAGLAAALLVVAVLTGVRQSGVGDLTAIEEILLGRRLDLLRQYQVVERLDLLEDLDVIQQLDRLSGTREG